MKIVALFYLLISGLLMLEESTSLYIPTLRWPLFRMQKLATPMLVSSLFSSFLSTSTLATLNDYDPVITRSIERIERLSFALNDIEKDINENGNPEGVLTQIRFLLNTYDIKDHLQKSLPSIRTDKREEGKQHGKALYEDLRTVLEYFPEDFDPLTGRKRFSPQILPFSLDAVKAAKTEIYELNRLYPREVVNDLVKKIQLEYNPNS